MLKCSAIFNIEDKKKILQDFNSEKDVWVTSDIKSREFIFQQLNRSNSSTSNNQCVFRASDFWPFLLSMIKPSYQMVSRTALIFLYQQWAESQQIEEWKKAKETGVVVCQYLYLLAHLLQHPDRTSLMQEWFVSFPGKQFHWKQWYYLASGFWDDLCRKDIMESFWADVQLLDKTQQIQKQWGKIVFDLSCHINRVEVELICQLSDHRQVQVLVPIVFKDRQYQLASDMYKSLTIQISDSDWIAKNTEHLARTKPVRHLTVKKICNSISRGKIYHL